jgi:WD40 repeat protein
VIEQVWDTTNGLELHPVADHTGQVTSLAFLPDGRSLLSRSAYDNKALVWDATTGKLLRRLLSGLMGTAVAFSPDSTVFAQAEWLVRPAKPDPAIRLWDTSTGKQRRVLLKHTDSIHALAFSPDGKLLASTARDGTICL